MTSTICAIYTSIVVELFTLFGQVPHAHFPEVSIHPTMCIFRTVTCRDDTHGHMLDFFSWLTHRSKTLRVATEQHSRWLAPDMHHLNSISVFMMTSTLFAATG